MPKLLKRKIHFGYNRFPADEFKCIDESCCLGNRLASFQDLKTHVKSHWSHKPEEQDSGFHTDQSGEDRTGAFFNHGANADTQCGDFFTNNTPKDFLTHGDRHFRDNRDIVLEGQLERNDAMKKRYTPFDSSLLYRLGIDFQAWDTHKKIRIQCQTDGSSNFDYQITFFTSDFDFSLSGSGEEAAGRSFVLPQRLIDQKLWSYRIVVSLWQ